MEKQQAIEVIVQVVNAAVKEGIFTNTGEAYTAHVALQTLVNELQDKPQVEEEEPKKASK